VQEAERRGFRQMIAVIGDSGNRASIRLHERVGFVLVGTLQAVGWKHGKWLDVVIMQRPLGPGATTGPQVSPAMQQGA
jgi:phosphinothricin acetyltransferase